MGILVWDQPKKIRTPAENAQHYGFEDGPTGGYQPNMSNDDAQRWKAKLTGTKRGTPQVEIRKTVRSTMVTIIVCLNGGYTYKHYEPGKSRDELIADYQQDKSNQKYFSEAEYIAMATSNQTWTNETQIHLAANGPIQFTFAEFAELGAAIDEAKQKLSE